MSKDTKSKKPVTYSDPYTFKGRIPLKHASFAGGSGAADFGSLENLAVAGAVLTVIVALKHFTKGITSTSAILFGIIFGYTLCGVLGLILPKTGVNAEGAEFTKAWVLNWSKVGEANWFSVPELMPVKPTFHWAAILPIGIMFIVTAVETVGDIAGCIEGGMGREATDKEDHAAEEAAVQMAELKAQKLKEKEEA